MSIKALAGGAMVSVRNTLLGKGVFARKRFRKNQPIGEVRGKVVEGEDYDSRYCIELSASRVLEPVQPFRFLNHSCEPNCEIYSWEPDERGDESHRVFVQALRTIQPGEELTIDYAWPADAAIPCMCKTEGCRGWIVDESELAALLRRERRSGSGLKRKRA